MSKEEIIRLLSRISTLTGITSDGSITLSDYDRDKIFEYIDNLEKQNKQKDKTIDECIELVENSDEYLLLQESHLNHEGYILSRILEKLQQVKGDCDE